MHPVHGLKGRNPPGSDPGLLVVQAVDDAAQAVDAGLRLAAGGGVWQRELKLPAAQLGRFVGQWARLKEAPGRSVFIERGRYDVRMRRVTIE